MTTAAFTVDLTDPALAYTALASVGVIEEVGINGVGYMLADKLDLDPGDIRAALLRYQRQTVPLDPQRFATGSTPFTESIERYSFFALADFQGGAGQRMADRDSSDPTRYWDSEGINPFTAGQATLLNATTLGANTYAALRGVVVGTRLYLQTGAKQISYYDTIAALTSATPTGTFSVAAATTIVDLTTDGVSWYAAAGAQGIFKGTTSDPGAAWSAQLTYSIGYAAGRVCAGVATSGTTPNRFTTLNSSGVEEVASGRITLNVGTSITNFAGGNGFVWFGAYAGDVGWVYKWDVTSASPAVALEPLPGFAVRSIGYGQGQVFVRAERRSSTTSATARIFRCPVSDVGNLTPFAVVDLLTPAATDHGPGTFGGDGDLMFFSWNDQDTAATGIDGLGAISLTSGGYCKWHRGSVGSSTAQIRSIFRWQNRLCFSLDGVGVYVENPSAYLTSATLTTSNYDQGSSLSKIYDFITLVAKPLGASESIAVEYSTDQLVSFLSYSDATLSGAGTSRRQSTFARKSSNLALRLTVAGPGTTTPTLTLLQLRLHPNGLSDTVVQIPVNCGDDIGNLQGGPFSGNKPGAGALRARSLETLVQSRILFQDIDYQATRAAETFEVVNVDIRSASLTDRHKGVINAFQVAVLTLRKAAK